MAAGNLPLEATRKIFETAALLDRETSKSLLFVSKAVKEWVDPIFYRVVVLYETQGDFQLLIDSISQRQRTDPTFYSQAVRALSLPLAHQSLSPTWKSGLETILLAFDSLTSLSIPADAWIDLGIQYATPPFNSLTYLRLTKTDLMIGLTIHYYVPPTVTHLAIPYYLCTNWARLFTDLPCLTHLIWENYDNGELATRSRVELARKANYMFTIMPPSLRALVYVPTGLPPAGEAGARWLDWVAGVTSQVIDPRFVFASIYNRYIDVPGLACYPETHDIERDWGYRNAGIGPPDVTIWEFADNVVDRRFKSGAAALSSWSLTESYLGV
ncbi:hypothetical protein CYLTODRAFT_445981 [Cylindrobasidium torrendii FP15055 ss-10]|uniref:F-box domain-containing protein n=1 Tax=Cylindrobasidium torrendii FP15055 ss-10 TaxID=1314674 RepID=A0A0D7B2M9_9AGAR|nr:hypothetical protein CYLTODRAFT_445981 [Cylindrobasidium torrendii FP15055 ss-10]